MFPMDSSYNVEPPTVTAHSRDIYQTYVNRGLYGAKQPSKRNLKIYQQYFCNKFLWNKNTIIGWQLPSLTFETVIASPWVQLGLIEHFVHEGW